MEKTNIFKEKSLIDRLNAINYSGWFFSALEEHSKTGKSIKSVSRMAERFWDNWPSFSEWLAARENFEREVKKLSEVNK